MFRRVLLILIFCAPASVALAGPVPTPLFTYTVSTVRPAGDKSYLGSIRGYNRDDSATDWAVVVTSPVFAGTEPVAVSDALYAGDRLGKPGTIGLGGQSKGVGFDLIDLATPAGQSLGAPDESFKLLLTVTDTASGEAGTAEFAGRYGYINGDGSPPNVDALVSAEGTATLYLGTNIYTFTAENQESESSTSISAAFTVTALESTNTASTPEPATLVSAALGLATLAGAARRRGHGAGA